jgi:hypothetical protein
MGDFAVVWLQVSPFWNLPMPIVSNEDTQKKILRIERNAPKSQMRIERMAASATAAIPTTTNPTANFGVEVSTPVDFSRRKTLRRRRISPRAGRALEILGHAIDYLIDENVYAADSRSKPIGRSGQLGQMGAVQMLMQINRQIYFECPEVPSVWERWRALLGLRTA